MKKIRLIELTSKEIKKHQVASIITVVFGMIIIFGAANESGYENEILFGCLITFSGLIWMAITRIRRWWHHG